MREKVRLAEEPHSVAQPRPEAKGDAGRGEEGAEMKGYIYVR